MYHGTDVSKKASIGIAGSKIFFACKQRFSLKMGRYSALRHKNQERQDESRVPWHRLRIHRESGVFIAFSTENARLAPSCLRLHRVSGTSEIEFEACSLAVLTYPACNVVDFMLGLADRLTTCELGSSPKDDLTHMLI